METLKKDLHTSYRLSPAARSIIEQCHRLLNMSRTQAVELAVLEFGERHLTPELKKLHALMTNSATSGGTRRAT